MHHRYQYRWQICYLCKETGGKFAASVIDTGGKLGAGVNYISGKFATGINDTGSKFCLSLSKEASLSEEALSE